MLPVSYPSSFRIVQSRQNRRVKELRASFSGGGESKEGRLGIEGRHLLEEALRSGVQIDAIFVRRGNRASIEGLSLPPKTELLELSPEIFERAVATESPQGIAALLQQPQFSLEDLRTGGRELFLVLDALQDPGNLGTLVRSAEAFGASGIIGLPGTANAWNSKALRASAGSAFRLPMVYERAEQAISFLRGLGAQILAATASAPLSAAEVDLTRPTAFLIGNEGRGISHTISRMADGEVSIRYPGKVESLNAAIAATIFLYEAARQRKDK